MKSTQKLVDSPAKDFGYVFCVLFLRRIPAHKEKPADRSIDQPVGSICD
ncbi:hypothetical protein HYV71_03140 [Candidatus Uhrbacteria bacterium]|nr:hypothetical protein [Candidatus Uhrbacteria bacterium]